MAKGKKSNATKAAELLESSTSPILDLSFSEDPLFASALHPSRPILITGTATGNVHCLLYDSSKLEDYQESERNKIIHASSFEKANYGAVRSISQSKKKWWTAVDNLKSLGSSNMLVSNWKTKRHKGSCRAILFDPLESSLGENVYTVGSDNVIKKAKVEDGKVIAKTSATANYATGGDGISKMAHSSTHNMLLVGTENGDVLVYDSKNLSSTLKFEVRKAHEDVINCILPMPAVSAYHYLTLGSTTLAHIDIRKGIITQSDDQEDELLSMCYPNQYINENKNDTVLISHGEGIVTIWKNSKNNFMDQLSRIKVNKHASIDCIIPTMNQEDEESQDSVWCGDSDGFLYRINYKKGKVVETRAHSNSFKKNEMIDEVGYLDIDYEYRLLSAGMDRLRIWSNREFEDLESESDSEHSSSSNHSGSGESSSECGDSDNEFPSESDAQSDQEEEEEEEEQEYNNKSRVMEDFTDSSDDESSNSASDSVKKREKVNIVKRKRNISHTDAEHQNSNFETQDADSLKKKARKQKEKKLSVKQLRNNQKHEHGIRKFEGL